MGFKLFVALLLLYLGVAQNASANIENIAEYPPISPSPTYAAEAVVLMDASTGVMLYATNPHEIKYPASITKIMTALVVLEQVQDLSQRIEFSDHAIFATPRYSSHIAMDVGETLTIYEALNGLMLASANEVSLALAEHIAGSVEDFVILMNQRAKSLGANNTYFVNPSGLPGAGHVTTAYDMAIIMREAISHPVFVDIINTRRFDIPPTERQPEVRALRNTNRLIHDGPYFNPSVVGGKTGWTNDAGHTLVTYASDGDRHIIVSVLGSDSPTTFADTAALIDYGLGIPFVPTQIFEYSANTPAIPVFQEVEGSRQEIARLTVAATENMYHDLPQNFDPATLRYNFSIPQGLAPPIEEGTTIGTVAIYADNFRLGVVPLLAQETVLEYVPVALVESDDDASGRVLGGSLPYVPYDLPQGQAYQPNYSGNLTLSFGDIPGLEDIDLRLLAVPVALAVVSLLVSLIIYIARSKNRQRKKLHRRYARYPHYYRYK